MIQQQYRFTESANLRTGDMIEFRDQVFIVLFCHSERGGIHRLTLLSVEANSSKAILLEFLRPFLFKVIGQSIGYSCEHWIVTDTEVQDNATRVSLMNLPA